MAAFLLLMRIVWPDRDTPGVWQPRDHCPNSREHNAFGLVGWGADKHMGIFDAVFVVSFLVTNARSIIHSTARCI